MVNSKKYGHLNLRMKRNSNQIMTIRLKELFRNTQYYLKLWKEYLTTNIMTANIWCVEFIKSQLVIYINLRAKTVYEWLKISKIIIKRFSNAKFNLTSGSKKVKTKFNRMPKKDIRKYMMTKSKAKQTKRKQKLTTS